MSRRNTASLRVITMVELVMDRGAATDGTDPLSPEAGNAGAVRSHVSLSGS